MKDKTRCGYCGCPLPIAADKHSRRVRSYHFENCPVRLEQSKLVVDTSSDLEIVTEQRDALLAVLKGLVDDVQGLIGESHGVVGLHLNGDVAPWGELEAGGRFERLTHLPDAYAIIASIENN